eukprot:3345892-Prymnesium_polylepis.1
MPSEITTPAAVRVFGEVGVLRAQRGPTPAEVEIFGEVGILQAQRGPAPAEVEVLRIKGVFGAVRGPAPSYAAAVAQGREATCISEEVHAFVALHPDAELLPGGV